MHDIKFIRENPKAFDQAMARRNMAGQSSALLALDEERRAVQTELQKIQAERNAKSQKIGEVKKAGGDAAGLMDEVMALKNRMTELEEKDRTMGESLNLHLSSLPNILFDETPDGKDESQNVELRRVGTPILKKSDAKDHTDIGEALGMMDFETAAKISGSRFVLMHSGLARLERALAQFMLDTHTGEHGYTEVSPPLLVNDKTAYGTGQLPKFAEDLFRTTRGDWLIPTAEVPLTNMVADMIIDQEDTPRRYCAFTPCFRSEAGAAGKDTRGMLRQHQFYKVELVSITAPEDSIAEHERMTGCAENILKKLELPFRTIVLCSGDTGFGARKTYDIEVWLPGQDRYREISSCSNCGDFQARRMNARLRKKGEKETRFAHTLNGSGVAVGRALIAVLENYYDPADGGVRIPAVLKPYMGGVEKLMPLSLATSRAA
ncbi:MAG: serine--tRNA ligase [Alphaproteobacteria bacterium]|nr:serine--tRNA ligase [Alphaproteobacteria bacterium]